MIGRWLCKLGMHLPQNDRVGPCRRGCGHVTRTWTNGRIWERHVGPPPAGLPPPPPPGCGNIARPAPVHVHVHIHRD